MPDVTQTPPPLSALLDFTDRTVVLTGAASGMGAATLRLLLDAGAMVHTVDIGSLDPQAVPAEHHQVDLGDADAVVRLLAALPPADVLMNCAGIPNGGRFDPETVMRVNWLGLRLLTEGVLATMPSGGSVVHIASTAGRAWPERVDAHRELMAADTFDAGLAWVRAHDDQIGDGYAFSKETVQYYTHWRSVQLLPRGIRMNSVCPGITDTGIIADFRKGMGDDLIDHAEAVAGRMAQPWEMAPAMLFLADNAASSYITGVNLNIDHGTAAARLSDQNDPSLIWHG